MLYKSKVDKNVLNIKSDTTYLQSLLNSVSLNPVSISLNLLSPLSVSMGNSHGSQQGGNGL